MKYGVKVYWPDGEYLWVTEGDSKFHLKAKLFDTKEEADDYALNVWGENAKVEVYEEER